MKGFRTRRWVSPPASAWAEAGSWAVVVGYRLVAVVGYRSVAVVGCRSVAVVAVGHRLAVAVVVVLGCA